MLSVQQVEKLHVFFLIIIHQWFTEQIAATHTAVYGAVAVGCV